MYEKTGVSDLEAMDVEDIEPDLKAVGYELRPEKMRPSVWEYGAGETNNWHRQEEQEELYYVLDGQFRVTVADEADTRDAERETFELGEDEVAVIPPETWRQVEAEEGGRLLVVGAPNVKDDGILKGEES